MRVVTEKYTVYEFDELTEEGQDAAVEKNADINVDFDWWDYDGLLGLSEAEMKARHMSRDYMSADGCMIIYDWKRTYFDGCGYSRNKYIQFHDYTVTDEDIFRRFLRIPKRLWENCDWHIDDGSGSGYYGYTSSRMQIEPDFWDGREFTEHQQTIVDRAIEIMNDKIDEALQDLISSYDYLTSREAIVETIKANEYTFRAEGNIA